MRPRSSNFSARTRDCASTWGAAPGYPPYRQAGWHAEAPWWGVQVRKRAGRRHHPLAEILNGFAAAGLVIERVAESGPRPVPITLAIRACKPS
jgi:hypothetical protein